MEDFIALWRISSLDPPSLTFRGFFEASCVQKDGTGEALELVDNDIVLCRLVVMLQAAKCM
jgi:hypothetical protein